MRYQLVYKDNVYSLRETHNKWYYSSIDSAIGEEKQAHNNGIQAYINRNNELLSQISYNLRAIKLEQDRLKSLKAYEKEIAEAKRNGLKVPRLTKFTPINPRANTIPKLT